MLILIIAICGIVIAFAPQMLYGVSWTFLSKASEATNKANEVLKALGLENISDRITEIYVVSVFFIIAVICFMTIIYNFYSDFCRTKNENKTLKNQIDNLSEKISYIERQIMSSAPQYIPRPPKPMPKATPQANSNDTNNQNPQ